MKRALLLALALISADTLATDAKKSPTIARHWHGKVATARAAEYEAYLRAAIEKFPTIKGNHGYQMLREPAGDVRPPFLRWSGCWSRGAASQPRSRRRTEFRRTSRRLHLW